MLFMFAAAAASAFNLACAGTLESESLLLGKKAEPYSVVYRIDLDAKQWCDGECKALHPISSVQPTSLSLEAPKDIDTPSEKEFFRSSIDRETGKHMMLDTSGRGERIMILKWEGQCAKQPFTGFPKFETKF